MKTEVDPKTTSRAASSVEEFYTLPISFQFHHVQMDGGHAARFLERLQEEINNL